ncbi:hypothetical protein [Aeoliella mucimassa]|uniref:hypothetical protein n=1 Tax=Aeoliella mucimassa TaxID=2527972 RepID=UPI0018D34A78|nr:hypothetical protein [Aeoliella mucimassa]
MSDVRQPDSPWRPSQIQSWFACDYSDWLPLCMGAGGGPRRALPHLVRSDASANANLQGSYPPLVAQRTPV